MDSISSFFRTGHGTAQIGQLDSSFLGTQLDSSYTDTENGRDLLDSLSGKIKFLDVVNVNVDFFHGFVYNLQTESEWYLANNIITHNCRHSVHPWIETMELIRDPDAVKKAMEFSNQPFIDSRDEKERQLYKEQQDENRRFRNDLYQYERYKQVLGEDAPESLTAFRRIKKADGASWERLQKDYRRTNLHQASGYVKKPDSIKNDYSDFKPLDLNEADKSELLNLHELSKETGWEHGNISIDGAFEKPFTNKEQGIVSLPNDIKTKIAEAKGKTVKIYHSHTNITPPSGADFRQLFRENVDEIQVIAYNKDAFVSRIGDGWLPDENDFEKYLFEIRGVVDTDIVEFPGFDGWTYAERKYMAIREQSYRIARNYGWTLEGDNIL
jgi:hypothetical protein